MVSYTKTGEVGGFEHVISAPEVVDYSQRKTIERAGNLLFADYKMTLRILHGLEIVCFYVVEEPTCRNP